MANTTADLIDPKIASNQTEVVVMEDVSGVEVMVVVRVDTVDDGPVSILLFLGRTGDNIMP